MQRKLIISENNIKEILLQEFNNNYNGVKFLYSNWAYIEDGKDTKVNGTLLIERMAMNNGRFDVIEEFNENTYATNERGITPINFGSLNAQFLTHPVIQEVNFSPMISILVPADKVEIVYANRIALEELRARFMQYTRVVDVESMGLSEGNDDKYLSNVYKLVFTSGEIDYGQVQVINGRKYIVMSMELNIFATNFGEFTNQQKCFFGVDTILDDSGNVKMFDIPYITWHYGTATGLDNTQFINAPLINNERLSSEAKASPVSKAFALSFLFEIDFDNEFLTHVYKESVEENNNIPIYKVRMVTEKYDKELKKYINVTDVTRDMVMSVNQPPNELSLGDKISHMVSFEPSFKKVGV